jgi:diguanylate cyclase (GGDEF)-like protein
LSSRGPDSRPSRASPEEEALALAIDRANEAAWDTLLHSPAKALKDSQRNLAKALAIPYGKGAADAYLNIGWCEYHLTELAEAYTAFSKALEAYDLLTDSEGACKALNAIGAYFHEISQLDKAIDYYTQSLERARKYKLQYRELVAMTNIGELCLSLGNPKEGLDYLLKAYELQNDQILPELSTVILLNIAQAFLELGNYALAQEFAEKAYGISSDAKDLVNAAEVKEVLARIAISEEKYADAERHLKEALRLAGKTESLRLRGQLLIAHSELLLERERVDEAVVSLHEAIELCETTKSKNKLYRAYENLARAMEKLGDFPKALEAYKKFSHFRTEVLREDTAQKVRSIQVQAEIDRAQQEAEIYRLRNTELKEKTDALEQMNKQIVSISEIGKKVTASLNFKAIFYTLYENLKRLISYDFFGIALYNDERNELIYRDFYEDGEIKHGRSIRLDADNSFTVWSFQNRKPVLIEHKDEEYQKYLSRPSQTMGNPCQSIVSLPLLIEDRVLGCLMVQHGSVRAYSDSHMQLLQALAPYIAIAIENSLIHDRLQELNTALSDEKRRLERATLKISHLANHDTLTGLPNRRLLFELVNKAIESAHRTGDKLGVAFIDLDDFKPVNDLYGHAAGDSALVAMGERLKSLLRASDIVSRVGGDEFIAVFTNVKDKAAIEATAHKLLEGCALPLSFAGNTRSFAFSMGIAVYPDDGLSIDDLINKADAAMYSVKRADKHAFAFTG